MATQLRSKRNLPVAGEDFDWYEVDPHLWELAFPNGGPVIGRILQIPAHGRDKETWVRKDNEQRYTSAREACADLVTTYYRRRSQQAPALTLVPPTPEPSPEPTPITAPPARPLGVPEGWLSRVRAAVAYDVPVRTMEQWIADGTVDHVTAGTAVYVPPPPAEPTPEPVPEPVAAQPTPEPEQAGRWVTKAEAAKVLGIGLSGVQLQIAEGRIPARKTQATGARWHWEVLIPTEDAPEPATATQLPLVQTDPAPEPKPAPVPAPLADFPSPTIEVPYAAPDDHPLDDAAPASEIRLLAAYERIGYLTAQLEHWQAEAERREQKCLQLADKLNNQALLYRTLGSVPREDDPDLAGPIAREPKPRRWFPFSW